MEGRGWTCPQPAFPQVLARPPSLAHLRGMLGLGFQGRDGEGVGLIGFPPHRSRLRGLVSPGVSSDSEGYFTRCMILNGISTICSTP